MYNLVFFLFSSPPLHPLLCTIVQPVHQDTNGVVFRLLTSHIASVDKLNSNHQSSEYRPMRSICASHRLCRVWSWWLSSYYTSFSWSEVHVFCITGKSCSFPACSSCLQEGWSNFVTHAKAYSKYFHMSARRMCSADLPTRVN